ncbi:MAG: ribbon-helix-helix domain-containing protein [Pseudomonadota bacterium]|nr:ribbon-helix-helix domain-containing protein [Pseudomonadota bacterium]MEC8585437.1 ribbon-helix-helix domain-containing protein [Pseudomonadota bacterium]
MPQVRSLDRSRRNIFIGDRRTSVSLEILVWEALVDVCRREEISLDEICTEVENRRLSSSMSSSLRMFLLIYYRYLVEMAETRGGMARGGQPNALREALKRLGCREETARLEIARSSAAGSCQAGHYPYAG